MKTLSWRIFPRTHSNTHQRAGLQNGPVCRQADLIYSQPQAMPAAPWSPTSGSMVPSRFSYQIPLKYQLLNFSLSSKTISKPISLQLFLEDPNNLGAVAKRTSSLVCCHAEQLVKLFVKVRLFLRHIQVCLQDSVSHSHPWFVEWLFALARTLTEEMSLTLYEQALKSWNSVLFKAIT